MSDELVKRVAALEAELAALKAQLPPVEKPFVPKEPWRKIDYTENFRLPASAVKAMCDVVGEMKDRSKMSDTRRPSYSEPGGFGPKPEPRSVPEVKRGSGWDNPVPLEGMIKGRWSKNDWED